MSLGLLIGLLLALTAYAFWLVRRLRDRPSWRRRGVEAGGKADKYGALTFLSREPVLLFFLALVLLVALMIGVSWLAR